MRRLMIALLFLAEIASAWAQTNTPALNAPELFETGMNLLQGGGNTRRELDAVDYFRRSAEQGYAPAQVVLGYFYDVGQFVAEEPGQALYWYKKAAAQDDALAQWLAGELTLSGRAVPVDLTEASVWLQKSAAQGNPFAAYLLGRVSLERQDYSSAASKFREAAMKGILQAQRQFALLLKDGHGVRRDRSEAYTWLLVSASVARDSVLPSLTEIEAALSREEIESAKARARILEQQTSRAVIAHGCTGWVGEFDIMPAPPPPLLQDRCRP
jgi:TPR repeat protein